MSPLGAVLGQLALPACVPFVVAAVTLGMARLEARLLEPGRPRAVPRVPPPAPDVAEDRTGPEDRTGRVPVLVPGPAAGTGGLDDQRV